MADMNIRKIIKEHIKEFSSKDIQTGAKACPCCGSLISWNTHFGAFFNKKGCWENEGEISCGVKGIRIEIRDKAPKSELSSSSSEFAP